MDEDVLGDGLIDWWPPTTRAQVNHNGSVVRDTFLGKRNWGLPDIHGRIYLISVPPGGGDPTPVNLAKEIVGLVEVGRGRLSQLHHGSKQDGQASRNGR